MSDACEERKRAFYTSKLPYDQSIIFGVCVRRNGRFLCWLAGAHMVWKFMSTIGAFVAEMVIYADEWKVFGHIQDVLENLAKQDNKLISLEQFKKLLLECGFSELEET